MRRVLTCVAGGSLLLAVLSGCTFLPPKHAAPAGVPSVGVPSAPPHDLQAFYGQNLGWKPCNDGDDCTTVSAPVNWDSPGDGAIGLAVIRHAATGKSRGALLVNPGGPGGSGYNFVANGVNNAVSDALAQSFDVVGWDPRGVGLSNPIVCYTDPKQIDQLRYGTFDVPYNTQAWVDKLTTADKAYAAACEKNTGELLGHIDSVSTAKDMDLIRAVLGESKLNYLGYSYGTFLGTVYAELFPGNVGTMVLDGAVDPLLSDLDTLKAQMNGFDSAFRAYMTDCLAGSGCPFTGSVDDALAEAHAVLEQIDGLKLTNGDGRVLDSATMGTAISEDLYSKDYWPDLTNLFTALQGGDPSLAFQHADSYNSRNPDGTYSDNSLDVYIAVTCLDGDFVKDPHSTLEGLTEIEQSAPVLGKYFALDDYAVLNTSCANWPAPAVTLPTSYKAEGAPPILVISTTNDPATPYAWGQSLAKQLSSGVLISHTGEGHTAYNRGNVCVDSTVDNYFVAGTVPSADPHC